MCMCGYTPFFDRSFTPESFNTLSRASSSWTHFVKRPFNHLALCGWCSTLRVGTCSTFVGTSLGNLWFSPHFRLLLPRSLPCSAFLAGTAHSVSEELCSTSCRHTSLYARGLGLFSGRRPFSSFLLSLTPPLSQVSLQKAYTAGASSPVDHINPSAHDSPPRCHCLVVSLRPHPLARVSHKCLHRRCFGKVSRVCQLYTDN